MAVNKTAQTCRIDNKENTNNATKLSRHTYNHKKKHKIKLDTEQWASRKVHCTCSVLNPKTQYSVYNMNKISPVNLMDFKQLPKNK